jgi:hypothetical protein
MTPDFVLKFHRLNGEVIVIKDLSRECTMHDIRKSILKVLPNEDEKDLLWFFCCGMPLPVSSIKDYNYLLFRMIPFHKEITLTQHHPDPGTMAILETIRPLLLISDH